MWRQYVQANLSRSLLADKKQWQGKRKSDVTMSTWQLLALSGTAGWAAV